VADPDGPPPLRADARRNLDRILVAAREVLAERGMEATMDEVARRAGVGHATVYRRFPTKEELVVTVMERHLARLLDVARAAAGERDAWTALRGAIEQAAAAQAEDRCFLDAVGPDVKGTPRVRERYLEILSAYGQLLRRAQEAGQVRTDLEPEDLPFLLCAAASSVPGPCGPPELWRRYLGVMLDGMRPEVASDLAPRAPTLGELEAGAPAEAAPV
jgi:AcrR family transcriptional regulator